MKTLYKITLFFVLLVCAANAFAQQTGREKAIELYRQAKYSEAADILQRLSKAKETKTDALIWNYLGLTYLETGELKKARKALEKAVDLNPQNADFRVNLAYVHLQERKVDAAQSQIEKAISLDPNSTAAFYLRGTARIWERKYTEALADADRIIAIDPNFSSAYTVKSNAFVFIFGEKIGAGKLPKDEIGYLEKSIEALEYCLKNCKDNTSARVQTEKLEAMKAFYDYFKREPGATQPIVLDESRTPLKILTKPHARYTDKARQMNITGTISVYVLFAANGTIPHIIILNSLGYGLDEQVLNAARQIKFEPELKNGTPVSVVRKVSYSFDIY